MDDYLCHARSASAFASAHVPRMRRFSEASKKTSTFIMYLALISRQLASLMEVNLGLMKPFSQLQSSLSI
jgi:hypothetical protein